MSEKENVKFEYVEQLDASKFETSDSKDYQLEYKGEDNFVKNAPITKQQINDYDKYVKGYKQECVDKSVAAAAEYAKKHKDVESIAVKTKAGVTVVEPKYKYRDMKTGETAETVRVSFKDDLVISPSKDWIKSLAKKYEM